MRHLLLSALVLGTALVGCKKAPAPEAADQPAVEASPSPTPTPEPTPEPTPTPVVIDQNAQVIILCYHRFDPKPKDPLSISPERFETELQTLKDNGIEVISMDDFLAWRRGEKNIPPKSAVITIDDGYISGYTTAWPILQKFGYPFTMYVYTDYIKGGPKAGGQSMTWEQLAEMRDAGVDIGSHTISHSALNAKKGKSDEQYREWLKQELAGSKAAIEQKLGILVTTVAYPYGLHNSSVHQAVKDAGYEAGFTVYGQHLGYGADATTLGRYAIESTKPEVFQKAVSGFRGAGAAGVGAVEGSAPVSFEPASVSMETQPADGSTISDPQPTVSANLASLGEIDPATVTMRISGIGPVPAQFDPATKVISYKLQQKLRAKDVTVIISATVAGGRKVDTRWNFQFDPLAATPAAAQ